MPKHESVISEWPKHLTNESEVVEPLPDGEQTMYVLFRFQGADPSKYANQVRQAAVNIVEDHGDDVGVAFVTVKQHESRYVPKNSWPMVRGLFDYIMNWSNR